MSHQFEVRALLQVAITFDTVVTVPPWRCGPPRSAPLDERLGLRPLRPAGVPPPRILIWVLRVGRGFRGGGERRPRSLREIEEMLHVVCRPDPGRERLQAPVVGDEP